VQEIGKGSYGSVSKIMRNCSSGAPSDKYYCWKEINYGHLNEKECHQIQSEINVLSKLNHPNIVKYIEKIEIPEKKKLYIVMEYCEHGDMS
jgi:serine/threonine protein kinase